MLQNSGLELNTCLFILSICTFEYINSGTYYPNFSINGKLFQRKWCEWKLIRKLREALGACIPDFHGLHCYVTSDITFYSKNEE